MNVRNTHEAALVYGILSVALTTGFLWAASALASALGHNSIQHGFAVLGTIVAGILVCLLMIAVIYRAEMLGIDHKYN